MRSKNPKNDLEGIACTCNFLIKGVIAGNRSTRCDAEKNANERGFHKWGGGDEANDNKGYP